MPNNTVTIENARILFRNFSGEPGQYNAAGQRNFCVLLSDAMAEELREDGWNVKYLKPRDEDELPQPYIQVNVGFNGRIPPRIVLINSKGKTLLSEETVNILDWADISNVDLIMNASHWSVGGRSGTKGYVKSMFVTIVEDELELKYRDVPDSAQSSMVSDD